MVAGTIAPRIKTILTNFASMYYASGLCAVFIFLMHALNHSNWLVSHCLNFFGNNF